MEEEFTEISADIAENTAETLKDVGSGLAQEVKGIFHLDTLKSFISRDNIIKIVTSVIAIIIFYAIYRIIKNIFNRHAKEKLTENVYRAINKTFSYVFYVLLAMYILGLFGISLKAVWGAAGIAGIAIGFAAQTSVSNFISGIFVLSEKAMKPGDFIDVGGVSGTVDSIGLLSVKIHTPENQMIRIPNSTIINSNLKNCSHFPTRKLIFEFPVSYETDFEKALVCIKKVPSLCPSVLEDPAPSVFYDGFGDGLILKLAVWIKTSDLIQAKNEVYVNIIKVCNENGIDIPYTHFDIKIVDDNSEKKC